MNQVRAPVTEKPQERVIDAKSTPFFGQYNEKKNPLFENKEISITKFDPASLSNNNEKNSAFAKYGNNKAKVDKEHYYMDTPSKKKEQENETMFLNKTRINEKEIVGFSSGSASAFKKFGFLSEYKLNILILFEQKAKKILKYTI